MVFSVFRFWQGIKDELCRKKLQLIPVTMDLGGGGIKALASLLKDPEAESDSEDDQVWCNSGLV